MTRPSISSSLLAASLVVLGACAPAPAPVGYQYLSTPTLWGELSRASDTKEIMLIESELAVRGQTRSPDGTEYIGRRTAGTVGRTTYSRMVDNMAAGSGASPSNDKDCSDFSSGAAAQRFFIAEGGPTRDPHRLDGDGDGNACDWGRSLSSSVSNYRRYTTLQNRAIRPSYTPRRQSSSTCYTGPRGGTYTITASGNKNYSGC